MSAHNGDKSRFHVNRKRAVLRRTKIRELMKTAKETTAGKASAKEAGQDTIVADK